MKSFLRAAIWMILVAFVFVSCSNHSAGIFASIARERAIIDDRELPNEITIGAMTSTSDQSRYFMASGVLRYRNSADPDLVNGDVSEWSVITSPGSENDNYVTSSVVEFNNEIFVSFAHQSGSPSGVYRIANPSASSPSLSSDPVFGSDDTGVDGVGELFVVNDGAEKLLVSVKTDTVGAEYVLYVSADGTTWDIVTGTDGADASGSPWTDAASDGTRVLYLTAAKVLVDSDGINNTNDPDESNTGKGGSAAFRGAHYEGVTNTLWLSDNKGFLYSSTNFGTSWTRNSSAYRYEDDSDEDPIAFTDFATINDTTTEVTVVGTEALGYYILGANASVTPDSPAESGSNYAESDLSALAVTTFFVDPTLQNDYPVPTPAGDPYERLDGRLLFAGTANGGLWRALFHDGATQWVRE